MLLLLRGTAVGAITADDDEEEATGFGAEMREETGGGVAPVAFGC